MELANKKEILPRETTFTSEAVAELERFMSLNQMIILRAAAERDLISLPLCVSLLRRSKSSGEKKIGRAGEVPSSADA